MFFAIEPQPVSSSGPVQKEALPVEVFWSVQRTTRGRDGELNDKAVRALAALSLARSAQVPELVVHLLHEDPQAVEDRQALAVAALRQASKSLHRIGHRRVDVRTEGVGQIMGRDCTLLADVEVQSAVLAELRAHLDQDSDDPRSRIERQRAALGAWVEAGLKGPATAGPDGAAWSGVGAVARLLEELGHVREQCLDPDAAVVESRVAERLLHGLEAVELVVNELLVRGLPEGTSLRQGLVRVLNAPLPKAG